MMWWHIGLLIGIFFCGFALISVGNAIESITSGIYSYMRDRKDGVY